tara:strand:- start:1922 stop:2149 length:228 start_codon:yes stop_codon:yes gene_type:complete
MTKIVTFSPDNPNGVERDMTAEEQAQHNADIAKHAEVTQNHKDDIANKETLKASAKAKLVAGEALTQEEADTIVL